MYRRIFLVAALVFCCKFVFSQPSWFVVKDLQPSWQIFEEEGYRPAGSDIRKTVYFRLNAAEHPGKYFHISSHQPWALFINGKIKGSFEGEKYFNIDSLRSEFYAGEFFVAIYKDRINKKNLLTRIVSSDESYSNTGEISKPKSYFRDFVFVAMLFLLIFLIAMIQLTRLDLSYFSGKKLFAVTDGDDMQPYSRAASGSNMLFFIFCSLTLSFYLMIIFRFTPEWFEVTWSFDSVSFWSTMWNWVKLSVFVLLAFVIKMIVVLAMSKLFGFKDFFGFQIFSWIRLLMITFGVMNIILVIYFISRGSNPAVYIFFYWIVAGVLLIWSIILLGKVARRSEYSMFHIFSYLCATEIIPLLISIKLLYN
jgi:hypothetical protein